MNILLYSHSFLPKIGGRELVVYQLARALRSLGHDVRIVGPRLRLLARAPEVGVRVHRYPRLAKGSRRVNNRPSRFADLIDREMMLQLVMDVRLFGADVIHAHSTYPAAYVATLARRWIPDIPLVITPHGVDINVIADFGLRLNDVLRRKIDRALADADAVTAISRGIFKALINAGTGTEKIHSIPNGTDLQRFSRLGTGGARDRFALDRGDRIVLTVGNYHRRKGMEELIGAFQKVVASVPNAKLVIVGSGTERLRSLARAAGIHEHLVLTGRVPVPIGPTQRKDDLLADLYAECDVYVSAAIDPEAEGLSLSVLDALAAGKPAVATRISGNEDVVTHGSNGFLVEPTDRQGLAERIIHVLNDAALAERMGSEARRRAGEFNWTTIASEYLRVYEIARAARLPRSAAARSG